MKQWTNEQLGVALIIRYWSTIDAGGFSLGRSLDSRYIEAAKDLLRKLRPGGDIIDWPSDEEMLSEASERMRRIGAMEFEESIRYSPDEALKVAEGEMAGAQLQEAVDEVETTNHPDRLLRQIISEHLGCEPEDIEDSSILTDDLGADSLDKVEMVITAEERFELEIHDDRAGRVNTFAQAVEMIKELLAEKEQRAKQ